MRREPDNNVVGGTLLPCSRDPLTGFYRDGCCSTGPEDLGSHTICAVVTAEFLRFSMGVGNDLVTPRPEFGFPGLRPGDRWCLCASRWAQAHRAGAVVLVDGALVKSCLMLAVQADGCSLTTVEGLAPSDDTLHPLQEAFWETHGLQCGFCTPGILITVQALLRDNPRPSDEEIRAGLSGNLCRCTGYQNIVKAVRLAAERMGGASSPPTMSEQNVSMQG